MVPSTRAPAEIECVLALTSDIWWHQFH